MIEQLELPDPVVNEREACARTVEALGKSWAAWQPLTAGREMVAKALRHAAEKIRARSG